MKIYVGAKFELKDKVREIYSQLEKRGHQITYKWTELESKNFADSEEAKNRATNAINGVKNCDVFILFLEMKEDSSFGRFVELGAAFATGKKVIIICSPYKRPVWFYHSNCIVYNTIEQVIDMIDMLDDLM